MTRLALDATRSAAPFQNGAYRVARGFLGREAVQLACDYAKLNAELGPGTGDSQVRESHARYADPLMECLLEQAWPRIEALAGCTLWPTYSYHRVYFPGAELTLHRDRPSCEVSATLCLGFDYRDVEPDFRWPLQLATAGGVVEIALEPGDLLLYEGCIVPHARPPLQVGAGSWHAQVFLHFVRREGRFALCRFDARPRLGLPASAADPELEQRILELEREVLRSAPLSGSERA